MKHGLVSYVWLNWLAYKTPWSGIINFIKRTTTDVVIINLCLNLDAFRFDGIGGGIHVNVLNVLKINVWQNIDATQSAIN